MSSKCSSEPMDSEDGPKMVTIPIAELFYLKSSLEKLDYELARLQSNPLVYATVVKAKNEFNLKAFEKDDRVILVDSKLLNKKYEEKKPFIGKISSNGVDKEGFLVVEYLDGSKDRLNIGLPHADGTRRLPQVRLLGKDDGTNVVIATNGKLQEVHGLPDKYLSIAEQVKVDICTGQIHDSAGEVAGGDVATVKALVDTMHCEVETSNGNGTKICIHGFDEIKIGDRVMLDPTSMVLVRILEQDNKDRFNLVEESNVQWEDIAGLGNVKEQLIEAVELPYQFPHVYKHYNKKPPKGVLLYGPPGCGKTLAAKGVANSMARIHGKENYQSGFIYVKGPELLSKYVGAAEAEVRSLFARGREHFAKHNYPALLFIDEAEAILPTRGSGISSDVQNTIVPMFLSEMDGLDSARVLVLLATNQPKSLDPAVCREGRVDRHIRVARPTKDNVHEYLQIHMRGIPLAKDYSKEELIAITTAELFSPTRVIYKVGRREGGEELNFTLADCLTGAMVAGLVDQATSRAMKRDMKSKKQTGVSMEDFQVAVQNIFEQHSELNPKFDLEEFYDAHGLNKDHCYHKKVAAA